MEDILIYSTIQLLTLKGELLILCKFECGVGRQSEFWDAQNLGWGSQLRFERASLAQACSLGCNCIVAHRATLIASYHTWSL